jgi:hypothetical protein
MRLTFDGDNPANQGYDVAYPDGGVAGTAYYCDDGEGRAKARALAHLFAAAPDLLAACEAITADPEGFDQRGWDAMVGRARTLARAAVARARGVDADAPTPPRPPARGAGA